jgi:hypothetical protein
VSSPTHEEPARLRAFVDAKRRPEAKSTSSPQCQCALPLTLAGPGSVTDHMPYRSPSKRLSSRSSYESVSA